MRKILVVALREYRAAVRTKSFLISVLVMPIIMFGGAGVQVLLDKQTDTKAKHFAIIDRTPGQRICARLQKAVTKRNKDKTIDPDSGRKIGADFVLESISPSADNSQAITQQRLDLSEEVRQDRYWGFVDIGAQVGDLSYRAPDGPDAKPDDHHSIRYQTNHPTFTEFPRWLQPQLIAAVMGGDWDSDKSAGRLQPLLLRTEGLSQRDPKTGAIVDPPLMHQVARLLVPAALVALMFMMIMLGSTPAMHGVVEEKTQRIAEVLLGSMSPFQLMLGKLAGLIGVSLTVTTVYLTGAYWVAWHYGLTEFLPASVLAWFVVMQMLAVLMYGSAFLAIGAAASDAKETQTLVLPVILVACIPMFILRNALEDPNNPVVVGTSFLPPVTPMLMMARIAISPGPPLWQPLASVALALVTTVACVYAAGRIFRVGILMQGKGARLGQMAAWVFRG